MVDTLTKGYAEIGWAGLVMVAMIWYFYYQTKCQAKRDEKHDLIQKEERDFSRGIVTHELKGLADASLKNADLQNRSFTILKDHNQYTETFSVKVVESLAIIADRLNGGTAGTKAIAKLKEIDVKDRRKKVKKVEEERRK